MGDRSRTACERNSLHSAKFERAACASTAGNGCALLAAASSCGLTVRALPSWGWVACPASRRNAAVVAQVEEEGRVGPGLLHLLKGRTSVPRIMGWWRSGMRCCALGSVPRLVASACLLFAILLGPVRPGMEVLAASAPVAPTIPAKVDCGALVQNGSSGPAGSAQSGVPDFSEIADFPTRITSANVVAAAGQAPEFCDVLGYIQPQIHFELKLPTTTWHGRYLQQGCSGFCGSINPRSFREPLSRRSMGKHPVTCTSTDVRTVDGRA
jgi:Tannase and feruloyl esterase